MTMKQKHKHPITSMTLLAGQPGWALYENHRHSANGWRSLKLVKLPASSRPTRPKHNWWLGHNGKRFASKFDMLHLAEHHSEILDWVHSVCATAHVTSPPLPYHVTA
jgi:hypothetical protein